MELNYYPFYINTVEKFLGYGAKIKKQDQIDQIERVSSFTMTDVTFP